MGIYHKGENLFYMAITVALHDHHASSASVLFAFEAHVETFDALLLLDHVPLHSRLRVRVFGVVVVDRDV